MNDEDAQERPGGPAPEGGTMEVGEKSLEPLTSTATARDAPRPPPTPVDADALVGRVIDGRYRVLATLGRGGMGAVHRAEHVQIHKPVALKTLLGPLAQTEEFWRRFEREARAASLLSHASCMSVTDFGWIATVEPDE